MNRLISAFYILFGWQWFPPSALASLSLVGIVATVVDPWCYLSGCMAHCEFAVENAWGDYDGKWGGLQFFGTGFLGAAALFSWPLLRDQTASCHGSRLVAALSFCFVLGHFALLCGIAGSIHQENSMLIKRLSIYIIIPLMILITPIGSVLLFNIVYTILWCRVLKKWAYFCSTLVA